MSSVSSSTVFPSSQRTCGKQRLRQGKQVSRRRRRGKRAFWTHGRQNTRMIHGATNAVMMSFDVSSLLMLCTRARLHCPVFLVWTPACCHVGCARPQTCEWRMMLIGVDQGNLTEDPSLYTYSIVLLATPETRKAVVLSHSRKKYWSHLPMQSSCSQKVSANVVS